MSSDNASNLTAAASRRRASFHGKVARMVGEGHSAERARIYALTQWWMSELRSLSPARRGEEVDRFQRFVEALNENRIPGDCA